MSRRKQVVEEEAPPVRCPHCQAGDPSVWDHVLFHYAHPAPNDKLKFCHEPWRERCRRCSGSVVGEALQPFRACVCAEGPMLKAAP